MLEYMRKNANSSVVWFIIGAIALVFIFFGVGGSRGGYKAITINGEEVNPRDYERMLSAMQRSQAGQIEPGQETALKMAVVSELIGQTLMRQFGDNMGLEPSDKAVAAAIAAEPMFQTEGRFDKARYESVLAAMRTDKLSYENEQRKGLIMKGVADLISGLSRVQKPEVMEKYRFQEDQVAVEYAFFPSEGLKDGLTPTAEQLNDYYLRNQEQWRFKTSMNLEYVELKPADFLDQAEVSDEELLDIYKDSGDRFKVEDSAEVSHILFRFPTMNPTAEEKQATLDKAKAAYERARNEDFAALAEAISEDPTSASEGGALGQVSRGLYFESFEKAAFETPVGEVSEPVESSIGYHLIKVASRQAAGVKPFEDVRDTLAAERRAFKAREAAVAKLEDLLLRTETNPKLSEAAKTMDLESKITDMFTEDNPPDFFEGDAEAVQRAFRAQVGRVASPVEAEDHLVVFVPLSRKDSAIPLLEEIKDKVAEAWAEDEAQRLARLDALHFIQRAGADWGQAVAELPARAQVVTGRSELGTRSALIMSDPNLNHLDQMSYLAAICSVAKAGQVSPLPVNGRDVAGRGGVFVLRLTDFHAADESRLSGMMLDTFSSMVFMNKANLMYQVWRESLYNASSDQIVVPTIYVN